MPHLLVWVFLFGLHVGTAEVPPAPQESAVPAEPQKLAVWLREDGGGGRIWQALVTASRGSAPAGVPEVLARHLLEKVPADKLEEKLAGVPRLAPGILATLGEALAASTPPLTQSLQEYLAHSGRSRSKRLGLRSGPSGPDDVEALLNLQLVDPARFASDESFRQRMLEVLPRAFDPAAPKEMRDLLLFALNSVPGVDFAASERIEAGWGAISRRSRERESHYTAVRGTFQNDTSGPIQASIYSLPSTFFDKGTAWRFLESVRGIAPRRTLVALVDLPLRSELEERAAALDIHLIETYGRGYTPWPRDPFSFLRRPDGGVLVLVRPNVQRRRQEDNFLGLELVQGLPASIDQAWGEARWARAPVPFHNGQVLLTRKQAWVSLHTLEFPILQRLGLERVPVESFATREGLLRYLQAARAAAKELESLYGRAVVFVHALPGTEQGAERTGLMQQIGGGAGFDLDSLLTIFDGPDGGFEALVGDLGAGRELLAALRPGDLQELRKGYLLQPEIAALRQSLAQAQDSPRAHGLAGFLDLIAENLKQEGLLVRRLPLFLVPVPLLRDRADLDHEDFLVSWNNVVLENTGTVRRAEGFSSLLPLGDARARAIFAESGYRLDLLPPLTRSVILDGGYRCASQHLRGSAPALR